VNREATILLWDLSILSEVLSIDTERYGVTYWLDREVFCFNRALRELWVTRKLLINVSFKLQLSSTRINFAL
jgi:hypothetical protein